MPTGDRTGSPKTDASSDRDRMFPRLTPEQMDRLASHGHPRPFAAGEVLLEAGAPIEHFYAVTSGAVESNLSAKLLDALWFPARSRHEPGTEALPLSGPE